MRFGILGPLLVHDGEGDIAVPAARQRVLLAALLLRAGRPVPLDELVEMVWDGAPPVGSATTLRTHVKRLRRVLGPRAGARLITRSPGYLLDATEEEVDLLAFTRLCRDTGAAVRAGDWAHASAVIEEALMLWRGTALTDVPSQAMRRDESARLEQLRLQAIEWQMDAGLHLGREGELICQLQSLAAEQPLRERFHAQVMLALYRCGRRSEALAAYGHARAIIVEELGVEPGTELQELHQRILAADPALSVSERAAHLGTPDVPRQLPAAVEDFTGRVDELAQLSALLQPAGDRPPTVAISAIAGTPGVGKTALAVYWAHQMADRFPDGQLYVNLRGYDPDQPVRPADALAGFLRSLGMRSRDIPADEQERSAGYRSLLAGRRMLIVLDNANSAEQVRPLLPGSPLCLTLITSRNSLPALVAREGARRLELDPLPLADAVELLRRLIGRRVEGDARSAEALARHCSLLPLALRLAAEFAAARQGVPLANLVDEIADQQRWFDLLDAGGDRRTAIRAMFSWSYRALDARVARVFRLLGLHPCADIDRYATAALTGGSLETADRALTELARAHLVSSTGPGHYQMHDLLRSYARELVAECDGDAAAASALTQLLDHYLYAAGLAMDALFPEGKRHRPEIDVPGSPAEPIAGPAEARRWLDAHRGSLVTIAVFSAEHDWPGYAIRLAATLFRYLAEGAHYAEVVVLCERARHAARRTGDRAAEAEALNNVTLVDMRQGSYQRAADHLRQAQQLYHEIGNVNGQARCQGNLGLLSFFQGRYRPAIADQHKALELYRLAGDPNGEARALNNLGIVEIRLGWYGQAVRHLRQTLELARRAHAHVTEAHALSNLALARMRHGDYERAAGYLRRSLAIFRERNDPAGEAFALTNLGLAELRCGRIEDAVIHQQQSLALCRKTGDEPAETEVLNGLAEVLLATGQTEEACEQYSSALALATRFADKYERARAHDGLGCSYQARGDLHQAHEHWQQAVILYEELETPEAGIVRSRLQQPV